MGSAAMALRGAAVRPGRLSVGWEAPALLTLTVLLLSFGLVSLYSASAVKAQMAGLPDYHFFVQQAVGAALGLLALALVARLDYRHLRLLAWPLLAVVTAMLVMLLVPGLEGIAPDDNGARRWLVLGPVSLQPSELAKAVLIVWTAAIAVKKQDRLHSLSRGLGPFLIVWAVVAGLIFLEPSLSAAMLTILFSVLVVYAAGARIGHFLLLGLVGLPLFLNAVGGAAYRVRRMAAFFDPAQDPAGVSYQINQALIALGSGGILGRGIGRGQQKFGFLPEPHNDFLFATIGEEWGFLGVLLVVTLYVLFALVGYRVARGAPDLFGTLLAIGMTNLIVVQALLHMLVNTALIPTTGVTLPLMSYGRTSILVSLLGVGVLLSVARRAAQAAL